MVRKMAYVGITYIAGLFFASFFAVKNNIIFALAITFALILYLLCFKNKRKELVVITITFIIAILMNITYTKLIYESIIKYDNQKISFSGEITDITTLNNDKAIYTVKGKINGKESTTLKLYTDSTSAGYYDKIAFEGTAKKLTNTLSFATEDFYKSKGIFLEADKINSISIWKNNNYPIQKYILDYRDYIYKRFMSILPGDEGAFLGALLCGDISGMDKNVNTTLFRAGIGHIISVSGSHLMIIAGLILLVLKQLKVNKYLRFFIVEMVMLAFLVFSGLAISALRAAVMFTILMLGTIAKRRADTLNSIGIAGLVLTVFNPFAIRDTSLLLSLAGVFGLAVFAPFIIKSLKMKGRLLNFRKAIITMVCVSVATFPFVAFVFNEVSIISPIANLLLEPLCSIALICALIVAFLGAISVVAYPLLTIAGLCLKAVIFISDMLIKIPYSYLPLGYSFIKVTLSICLVGIFVITFIFKSKKALLSSILSSLLIMFVSVGIFQACTKDDFNIAILTEKNSTAVVLYKNDEAGIIDISGDGEIAGVVSQYLNKKGIKSVNFLALHYNVQNNSSTYINKINAKINNIFYLSNESIVLPNNYVYNKVNSNDKIDFGDAEILYSDSDLITVNCRKFSLICSGKNDRILNNSDNNSLSLICNDEICELTQNNLNAKLNNINGDAILINVFSDGSYKMRRMNYALRE